MSSENIDAFAKEYYDRAYKRREMLAKKLADTSPNRKRITPLTESQRSNVELAKSVDDDSPSKRQCTRDEGVRKPDTPAIPNVKSRLQSLMSERKNWDDCPASDEPVAAPRPSLKASPAKDDHTAAPGAWKTRLANLAQYINSWEDDPKHVIIKKEEKPKKVWEPPKPLIRESRESNTGGCNSESKLHSSAPSKPERTFDHVNDSDINSPNKRSEQMSNKEEESKVTSTLTVNLGSGLGKTSNSASPAHPLAAGDNSSQVREREVCLAAKRLTPSRTRSPVKPGIASRLAALQQDAGRRRDSFEPSAQPVSARLADWQARVRQVEEEKHENPKPGLPKQAKSVTNDGVVNKKTGAPASSSPAKSPRKPLSQTSPIKSPIKVAPAAKTIQDKLQQLQESWKQNEIAEKLKQQRQSELALLENRWKNGVLNEESYSTENEVAPVSLATSTTRTTTAATSTSGVPPPPPLPTNISASPHKSAPVPKPASASKTPKPVSEEARKKIRAVHQEMLENAKGEQCGQGLSANEDPHFENKLKTLGFEIEAKPEIGKVATLDLKEQREKDRQKREADKCDLSPKKMSVKVTEQTLSSCKFGDENVTTKVNVMEGQFPVDVTVTPGRSIYSVIRKHTNTKSDVMTPNSSHQTTARPMSSTYKQFHDSFSSDGTSSEDEATHPTTVTITTTVERRPSTCSDYSTSQTDKTTQSEDEYSGTEYSLEETEATTQSDESSADESEANGEVSDLLEEAMDDTVSEQSLQYVARKLPPEAHPGHPDHQPNPVTGDSKVQLRHPPPKYPRLHQQREQKRVAFTSPGGSTYRSESSASEKSLKREIVHSIDTYRSSANMKINAPEPRLKIIRRSQHFDSDDSDAVNQVTPEPQESVQQQLQMRIAQPRLQSLLQELQELVNAEQNIIKQASNALNQYLICSQADTGPECAVECHRLLLQACKKREAYLAEMERLRSGRHRMPAGPKGSLTISNIQLPLKHDYIHRMNSIHERNTTYYFIVLFRQGTHVIFTQMVSTNDELINGAIQIPNMLPMIEIRQNFKIDMEIYSMSVTRDVEPQQTPKKKKGLTPKKFASGSKRHHPAFQSPGGPNAVSTSNFAFIAGLPITLGVVNKTSFTLNRVPMSSPLQGTVTMKLTCLLEALVEEKGFLTMFEDVSGLGNWHRRWCILKHNVLSYWKYPDDAKFKEPIGIIDLKSCITDEVGLIPRDVCARPNTFELVTVRRQQRGDFDTLVSQCYNTMTTTKHWLSADTKEDRFVWCHKFNEALRNLRMWNPDALRPIRQRPDTGV